MFIKTIVKTDKKSAKRYEYLRLCETYRIGQKVRHATVLSLGKVPELDTTEKKKVLADRIEELLAGGKTMFSVLLPADMETLAQKFYKKAKEKKALALVNKASITKQNSSSQEIFPKDYHTIDLNSFITEESKEIGSEWLCYQAIQQLGLYEFLEEQGVEKRWINTSLIHLISKAVFPASEHKTEQWISQNSGVCELFGVESSKINRHHLYQASNKLYALKNKIEPFLCSKTNELFDFNDKIILYDLTNTYFEGRKEGSQKAQFARSKEKRSDAKLMALALVTNAQGFVKYSKIYEGNIADCATLKETVLSLSKATSSQNRKPMVVIDAGIATDDNLKMLKANGYDYLCVTRSKLKDFVVVNPEQAPVKLYDKKENLIEVQRIKKEDSDDAFLYVKSTRKAVKEQSMASHYSTRYEEALNNLSSSLQKKNTTKKIETIHQRIGRIKERFPTANKHYHIVVQSKEGKATSIIWSKLERDSKNMEGVYFLRSSQTKLDETSLWNIYNTLTEIEATFRTLKTDLSLRPVYHQTDHNAEAHIYLGVLAYSIVATIRYQLKQNGINNDWSNIVRIMNTQKTVTNSMLNEKEQKIIIKTCSIPITLVAQIYQTLNFKPMPFYRKLLVCPEK